MNIIDYVKLNGDKTFNDLPFNEIDGLIFSELAYLNYNNICTSFDEVIDSKNLNSYETSILLSKKNYKDSLNRERLIREVLNSKRYYGVKFAFYVNDHNIEKEMQFSAISFIFDNFICVSYMGTDDTILGWKEDFSMSYSSSISSQIEGVNYLENIFSKYDLDVILVGHSKGGNIAIYSACNCRDIYKDRIKKVYSYDSPGFNKEFVESINYLKLREKKETYIPESSFVGLIMYGSDDYKIVGSNKLFIFQHSAYNWLVDNTGFVLKDNLSKKSLAFLESNRNWIESFTDGERKIFFDTIFDLLEYKDNKTFVFLKNNFKSEINRIVETSKEISNERKELISKVAKNMIATYLKLLFRKKKY